MAVVDFENSHLYKRLGRDDREDHGDKSDDEESNNSKYSGEDAKPVVVPIGQIRRARRVITLMWVALMMMALVALYFGMDYYRASQMYPMYVKTYEVSYVPCNGEDWSWSSDDCSGFGDGDGDGYGAGGDDYLSGYSADDSVVLTE